MYFMPFQPGSPLSITQLIANRTLDSSTASLFWVAVENGLSLVTAAGPPLAGKTTLLESLFVFLPPQRRVVMLRGMEEDFSFLKVRRAEDTFLYCPEISDHIWFYLWGPGVGRLFQAMAQGYQMGTTMHADSPQEIVYQLHRGSGVPSSLLSQLNLVAVLRVERRGGRLWRHLAGLSELVADEPGLPQVRLLMKWEENDGRWRPVAPLQGLKDKLGTSLEAEQERRRDLLEEWVQKGLWDPDELRRAVLGFYRQTKTRAEQALAS